MNEKDYELDRIVSVVIDCTKSSMWSDNSITKEELSPNEILIFCQIEQYIENLKQVIKSGNFEKVTLGIKGIDVTTFESSTGTDLAADEGVYIVEVVSDTPAQKSGIQAGDVIVKVGNDETPTMTDLNKVLYKYKSGQSTKVTVNRSGKEVTVDIKF